ncbi:hypothetical protein [Phenylobacterium sp.]|uniref:hypothetical protein n=1 Tax=Phenylobacterium sp. TaxID=1871053 RepID=UPI00121BD179|nr:hypothetical protein [Phenylobacterium sp.]THD58155.1 MAG: hypothetical protein E8A49_21085 [Phenylobacterium sp.]
MKTRIQILRAVLALSVMATGPAWSAAASGGVTLSGAQQKTLGVKTEPLAAGQHKAQVDAFAKVLDPGPLAQLNSDLLTAVAAAEASRAEAVRAKTLATTGGALARKDQEAAEAQAKSDALKVEILRQRLGLEWGPGVARMSEARRQALVSALSKGVAALVHVDTPSNAGQAGARTVKIDVSADTSVGGVVLGPARAAEPRLQSSGLIVEVTGPSAILLSVGLTQSAHIDTGSPKSGVVIKKESVVRYQGSLWAYVRHGDAQFERRLLQDELPEDGGYFVAKGFAPGEQVAVSGVAGLFAADLAAGQAR